ncbi:Uncharacterised protein [Campylobacter geochelonis]|uniref:Uncharacterized protein n=1 Tax=Campylobacter geochelonis TaxID=1780362 RepID=A0A128ED88_9BACT|nr:Uncharacterised protein [Campylobacter geochelonis]
MKCENKSFLIHTKFGYNWEFHTVFHKTNLPTIVTKILKNKKEKI